MTDIKKPLGQSGSTKKLPKNISTRKTPRPCTDKAIKIDANMKNEILRRILNENTQYGGFTKVLIRERELMTGQCNRFGGVNLSACANNSINPKIKDLSLTVDCRYPTDKERLKNRYGNPSRQVVWGFYPR